MKHLFIPYELAIIAKEKGFREKCFGLFNAYNNFELDYNIASPYPFDSCPVHLPAPTHQQIVDWFREKKISICENPYTNEWNVTIGDKEICWGYSLNKAIEEAFKLI